MAELVYKSYVCTLLTCVALLLTAVSARADEEPVIRDHRKPSTQPIIRDHRKPKGNVSPNNANPALVAALTKAAEVAINGPEVKKLNVNEHTFTVKKAKVSNYLDTLVISGQISHHLSDRPDDQVYYTINKRDETVTLASFEFQRGGVGSIVGYPGRVASMMFGMKITTGLEEACQATGKLIDGTWESSADLIVGAIGLKARAWSRGGVLPVGGVSKPIARPTGGVVRDRRKQ